MRAIAHHTTKSIQLMFLVALGSTGWATLALAGSRYGLGLENGVPLESWALFFAIILAARTMAFQVGASTVLALDSAFYAAAAVCLGAVPAGFLVALALTLDALARLVRGDRPLALRSVAHAASYVLYFGGMTGALIMLSGWLVGADTAQLGGAPEVRLVVAVCGAGALILALHYAIQGVRRYLGGEPPGVYLRTVVARSILAEISLLPLAAVVVLVYDPAHHLSLSLLGATYLFINFVYNRLSRASGELRERVHELEILSATARRLNATLEMRELALVIAQETAEAIPGVDAVTLVHADSSGSPGAEPEARDQRALVVACYEQTARTLQRLTMSRAELCGDDEGAPATAFARVMATSQPVCIRDLHTSDLDLGRLGAVGERAWMGVPIVMYGSVEGVLAVHSRRPGGFTKAHLGLLESIGMQAAAAFKNAHLYELAMVDGLTGLFMRRYFDARLEEELHAARRYNTAFSVVMMDIDNFKELNDTHGHVTGDRVLRLVGELVRGQMRGGDIAARYGGEEIAVILPRTDMLQAWNQAERIRAMLADLRLTAGDRVLGVTGSFGIAAYPDCRVSSCEELVAHADEALYAAKKNGKNRVELYWAEDHAEDESRAAEDEAPAAHDHGHEHDCTPGRLPSAEAMACAMGAPMASSIASDDSCKPQPAALLSAG